MSEARIRNESSILDSINHRQRHSTEYGEMFLEKVSSKELMDRQFRLRETTMSDIESAHALFDLCSRHMIGKPEVTLAHVRSEWTSPGFDIGKSTRVVDGPDGEIIGYVEVWDIDDPPVSIWVWGRVHPDYENQGIGTMLMQWAEQRARQSISRAPEDARVIMRSGSFSTYRPAHDLLADLEMEIERHFLTMFIELPEEFGIN